MPVAATGKNAGMETSELVARLRRSGCVFAEDEARILQESAGDEADLERLCARREAGEFLEHLVGAVEIGGEILSVEPGTFVPRQRTVLLIEEAIAQCRVRQRPVVLEAYCGVAPVAALIGREGLGARLHATDRDERALVHARRNLPGDAATHRGAGLSALPPDLTGQVDVLAAVPPYVPAGEMRLMPREAREHEPEGALVGGLDGLDDVRVLLQEAPRWLAPGGVMLIEMHHDQAEAALAAAGDGGALGAGDILEGEDGGTVIVRIPARQAAAGVDAIREPDDR